MREAQDRDREAVRELYLAAFPEAERELVSSLAVALLDERAGPPVLSTVATSEDRVVGHVAFSPVSADSAPSWSGYLLAPLAVLPERQKRGIGSALVEWGIERLAGCGSSVLLVYGDPAYYGRFGFSAKVAEHFVPPYPLQYPHGWQGLSLEDGSSQWKSLAIRCVPPLCHPELW